MRFGLVRLLKLPGVGMDIAVMAKKPYQIVYSERQQKTYFRPSVVKLSSLRLQYSAALLSVQLQLCIHSKRWFQLRQRCCCHLGILVPCWMHPGGWEATRNEE